MYAPPPLSKPQFRQEFRSVLASLTSNDKFIINDLTDRARMYPSYAADVIEIIERQIELVSLCHRTIFQAEPNV